MKHSLLWLIPLLLLSTGLGMRGLDADMLWWDEIFTLRMAGGALYGPLSPAQIWANGTEDIWIPPGYYILLNLWSGIAGWTPFAARSLSLFVGVLAVAWSYRLGLDVGNRRVGTSAATALGASAVFIWYSHELRNYTLLALITIIALWSYWRLIAYRSAMWIQVLFVLSIAGLAYTHYFALLVAAAIAAYHLLFVPKNRGWSRVPILMILSVVLTLPWLMKAVVSLIASSSNTDYLATLSLTDSEVLTMLGVAFSNGLIPLLVVPVLGLLAARRQSGARCIAFVTISVLALALVIHHFYPLIRHVRHILMLWPLLAVMVGFGLDYLARSRRAAALTIVLGIWTLSGIWGSVTPDFNDYVFRDVHLKFFRPHLPLHHLGRVITTQSHPDDAVVFAASVEPWAVAGTFEYYADPAPVRYTMTDQLPGDADTYLNQARRFLEGRLRVWLAVESNMPPDYRQVAFETLLKNQYIQCQRYLDYPDLTLDLYALHRVCCRPPETPPQVVFGDIQLSYIDPLPVRTASGEVDLLLAWNLPPTVPKNTYSTALHIWDEAGNVVSQYDAGLPSSDYSCQMAHVPLSALPAGEYHVTMSVYDWATGERLSGQSADQRGDLLPIGTFNRVIEQDQT